MAKSERPASLFDVDDRHVTCSVTGGSCRRECQGRGINKFTLATNGYTGKTIGDIKSKPPKDVAEILEDRIAGFVFGNYASRVAPEQACQNLVPKH